MIPFFVIVMVKAHFSRRCYGAEIFNALSVLIILPLKREESILRNENFQVIFSHLFYFLYNVWEIRELFYAKNFMDILKGAKALLKECFE